MNQDTPQNHGPKPEPDPSEARRLAHAHARTREQAEHDVYVLLDELLDHVGRLHSAMGHRVAGDDPTKPVQARLRQCMVRLDRALGDLRWGDRSQANRRRRR